jgi:hypothetical protein
VHVLTLDNFRLSPGKKDFTALRAYELASYFERLPHNGSRASSSRAARVRTRGKLGVALSDCPYQRSASVGAFTTTGVQLRNPIAQRFAELAVSLLKIGEGALRLSELRRPAHPGRERGNAIGGQEFSGAVGDSACADTSHLVGGAASPGAF